VCTIRELHTPVSSPSLSCDGSLRPPLSAVATLCVGPCVARVHTLLVSVMVFSAFSIACCTPRVHPRVTVSLCVPPSATSTISVTRTVT
jgi:hypothetical protein